MTQFAEANSLLRNGDVDNAGKIYRQLVRADPNFRPYAFNAELTETPKYGLGPNHYDVVIATDLRFPGGSSSSTLEEINANAKHGLKTGLYHLPAPVMKRKRPYHPGLMEAVADGRCYLIDSSVEHVKADVLLFRHPSVLHVTNSKLPPVEAKHVLLIINHPPSNAVGRIDYILTQAYLRAKQVYGVVPRIYPIGPLIRQRIIEFYGDSVPLEKDDWVNIFDVDRFSPGPEASPRAPMRIGRHSRPAREKWPSTSEDILHAYPEDPEIEVRILGGGEIPKGILGRIPANWMIYEFGEVPPEVFLKEIDVFVYFHHPDWLEAFGRVLVEAMAMGLPVIVPTHFRPLLGDACLYGSPEEVRSTLELLRAPAVYSEYSRMSRETATGSFSYETHVNRLQPLVERMERKAPLPV